MTNVNRGSVGGNTANSAYAEFFLGKFGAQRFTFQTYSDCPAKRDEYKARGMRDPLARILHGTLAELWPILEELSAAGAGIFVVVNETDFRGRATANIIRVRVYFVDLDGANPRNLLRLKLRPHLVTETSPGRYHAYWFIADATLEPFKSIQQRLAKLLGGDSNVCDLPRVMRLPGFLHQKDPARPFLVTVAAPVGYGPPYSDMEFQAALAEAEKANLETGNSEQGKQRGSSDPPNMRQGYPNSHRTGELTRRAGWCLGPWKMTEDQAVAACLAWNQYNDPPLPEDKVRSTVASIAKAEAKKRGEAASQSSSEKVLIDELARLDPISYDRRRKEAAQQLGIGVTTLDKAVELRRAELEGNEQEQPLFTHWDVYRSIEKWGPTLIIDEADVAFVQNEELRAVVNSGWTRGQGVLRCEGDEHEPRLFATHCPMVIGLKGKKLPDTTASRAIVTELKRKLAHEEIADFGHIDDPGLHELRQKLLRWANDNVRALQNAKPTLPHGFANRIAANWHLLLAIADAAGGEWPEKAREAAATIAKIKATLDASIGIQLLADIRTAFGNKDCLFSITLIGILTADPEGPWAGYNRGTGPLSQKQLANRLKTYGIVSETVWIDGRSAKGYKRSAFEDVWIRYLSE